MQTPQTNKLKKAFKFILKTLLGIIAFVALYLLSAFILSRITISKEANTKEEVTIYILTNGVHTDLVVPIKSDIYDWSNEIKYLNTTSKDSVYNYLAMGWGDKGFYLVVPQKLSNSIGYWIINIKGL